MKVITYLALLLKNMTIFCIKSSILIIILIFNSSNLFAQIENSNTKVLLDSSTTNLSNNSNSIITTNSDNTTISTNNIKKILLVGGTISTFAVTQIYQYKDYWSDRNQFTIMDWETEYNDALMSDKFGHFYFTYGLSKVYSHGLEWSGYNKKESILYGSILAFSYQLYVEIQDGFSKGQPYLGFSRGDIVANLFGAIYPNIQLNNEILENINFKINFKKSDNYDRLRYTNIINDYESTYHWVSFDIYNLLDENSKKYWTPYFNLAFGHSVKNINRYGSGNHELYISLDFNFNPLKELIGLDSHLINSIFEFINLYKLPSPTIKVHPEVVWVGFRI